MTLVPLSKGTGEWPEDGSVSYDELVRAGWTPLPFGQYLLKIASRCNLDCTYCYVYHLQDDTWRGKPRFMSMPTVRQAVGRIREHVEAHGLDRAGIVLHGGEPLLAGVDYLREVVRTARTELGAGVRTRFTIQTNGTLIDEEFARLFVEENISIGISVDGGREVHDANRVYPNGKPSYDKVVRGIRLMSRPEYRTRLAGLLCTINVTADPLEVYHDLLTLEPAWIDLLLPHATWTNPPAGKETPGTPYADWLLPIFDEWYADSAKRVQVRIFEEVISLLLGGRSRYESFGVQPVNLIVIEADGTYEQVDSLKAAYNGAAATGLNVRDHSLDDALRTAPVVARQLGLAGLCRQCQECEVVSVCGGGLYPHRYRAGSGYLNPSVYCADLRKLIDHVAARVEADIARIRRDRVHA